MTLRRDRREGEPPRWLKRVFGVLQFLDDYQKPLAILALCVLVPSIIVLVVVTAP